MNIKKVLVLNPYIPTLGGGEKHMGYMCQFIEKYYNYDVRIDILVHNYNEVDIHADDYVTIDDINNQFGLDLKNTHIRKLDIEKPTTKLEFLHNKQTIENISKEYDLFINFMFLSKHMGRAKVNIYQCMFPPHRFVTEMQDSFWQKMVGRFYDYKFFHSYQSMIANSRYTQHWLATYWKPDKKETCIYPPVFNENEIDGRYVESKKENIIVSVGRFFVAAHSKKQLEMVEFFVKHHDELKDYQYHLAGAVSNLPMDIEYLNKIKALAATVDNVFIHENCPFDELMDLYSRAKIFWHGTGYGIDENKEPEKMEHFGITTVEAMSYGAVPVVINKGGQKETVEQGVNGFRWNDGEECIKYTLKLANDDALREKMAKISVERSKDYSIEEFYRRHEEVFNELHI